MKLSFPSNRLSALIACFVLVAFAIFTSTSAANLNFSTLQTIDGPVTASQIEALRLSSALTTTSVAIFVGVAFFALSATLLRRSRETDSVSRTLTSPS